MNETPSIVKTTTEQWQVQAISYDFTQQKFTAFLIDIASPTSNATQIPFLVDATCLSTDPMTILNYLVANSLITGTVQTPS